MTNFKWGQPKPVEVPITKDTNLTEFVEEHKKERAVLAPEFFELRFDSSRFKETSTETSKEKLLIHRSAILSFKACPYKAYLEYFYNNHGVSPMRLEQHLLIGICIHRGLQHLLEHCRVEHPTGDFEEKCIDDAVDWAHHTYKEILGKREIALKYGEDRDYTIGEINNLIEALIRAYAIYRLKDFLEEYEVLEVEKEEVFEDFSSLVTWLGKADGLVRRRKDNALLPISYKTAADFSNSTMLNILIDMQGCSEIVAIEERLSRLSSMMLELKKGVYSEQTENDIREYLLSDSTPNLLQYISDFQNNNPGTHIKLFANQYEYLIKGKHKADSTSPNHFKYQNHLLHPIKTNVHANLKMGSLKTGLTFGNQGGEYEWKIPSGKLPANKRKIDIVDDVGIKNWIEMLSLNQIQPEEGSPFAGIIYGGEERIAKRTREQLKEWRISTQFQAEQIAGYLEILNTLQDRIDNADKVYIGEVTETEKNNYVRNRIEVLKETFQEKLLQFFPRDGKDAQLCFNYYGGKCPFTAHCHEGILIEDGMESGMWIVREPHHELERQKFIEKGWLKEDASSE